MTKRTFASGRGAWTSAEIGGKEGLVRQLHEAQLQALDQLIAPTKAKPVEEIVFDDFRHPALDAFCAEIAEELTTGRGAAIIRGCTPERYSRDELTRAYWGLGLHLGMPMPQTKDGDRIDHLLDSPTNSKDVTRRRKQYGNEELKLHTDNPTGEILGLMPLQVAKTGGVNRIASGLAIHNQILRERPDLINALYEGYPYYRKGRQQAGLPDVTPFNVPVFCEVEGRVSVRYVRHFIELAAEAIGEPVPQKLLEGIDTLDEVAHREEIALRFTLQRGEMLFINDLTVLHARTGFEDWPEPERRRHLLRLWMKSPRPRPFAPQMDMFWGSIINHSETGKSAAAAEQVS